MPSPAWSAKRKRQYGHIKESLLDCGKSEKTAKEIAARTVNKERARHREAMESSRSSIDDLSPGQRGGQRSHHATTGGPLGRTYTQLYNEARQRSVRGRSGMNKAELEQALARSTT